MNLYANKGMFLEELIEKTALYYLKNNIAGIFKRHIPIKIYGHNNQDIQAKLVSKSTTDYYGVYRGKMIDFEAKQTKHNDFILSNLKAHQWDHLINMKQLQAIPFIVLYFIAQDHYFAISIDELLPFRHKTKLCFEWCLGHATKIEIIFPGILDLVSFLDKKI